MNKCVYTGIILIISAFFLSRNNHLYFIIPALLLIFYTGSSTLKFLLKPRYFVFIILIVFIPALIIGKADLNILGLNFSSDIFLMNVIMIQRSIMILAGLKILTKTTDVHKLMTYADKFGMKNLSKTVSLSKSLLPEIKIITSKYFNKTILTHNKIKIPGILYTSFITLICELIIYADKYNISGNNLHEE